MMSSGSLRPSDASQLDAACADAMQLQLAGQLDLAGRLYHEILQAAPEHAATNYCLGMLQVQLNRPAEGLPFLLSALRAAPEMSDYWLGYLEALSLVGRLDTARNILALGRRSGLAGTAVEDFAQRLVSKLGGTRAMADPAPRPSCADLAPSPAAGPSSGRRKPQRRRGANGAIGQMESRLMSMVERRQFADALVLARDLTARHPDRGPGWKILGALMPTTDGFDEAITVMRTAIRLMPQDAETRVNLGMTLAKAKRFEEAETQLHAALALNPRLAAAHFRLGMTYEFQGRYAEAEASLRRGRAIGLESNNVAGDDELSYSHMLFLMGHNPTVNAGELFAEHRRYGEYFEDRLRCSWPRHRNDPNPDRCLRVGFVSGDLYEHSVAKFLEPIVRNLYGRPTLELHAYYNNTVQDDVSRRLQKNFNRWNQIETVSDAHLAAQIMQDGIDVLIDLSGHTGQTRLPVFARKPAPVQLSWLGYPGTTGLTAVDYYLADKHWLPPGRFDDVFTEKLAYLPDRWAFEPYHLTPPVNPLPALESGRLTFGSFHRLGKINSGTMDLWARLLLAVPQSTLLIAGIPLDGREQTLSGEFANRGVDPQRLAFHGRSPMDIYLALHHRVDIGLDTQPYAGATTTMYSLTMGVPTLTVAGATPAARGCAGILGQLGLAEFIGADADGFVEKGRHWAERLPELAQLRMGIRARMSRSPGGQPALIAAHFEAALRHMWRRWCAGLPPESFATGATVEMPR